MITSGSRSCGPEATTPTIRPGSSSRLNGSKREADPRRSGVEQHRAGSRSDDNRRGDTGRQGCAWQRRAPGSGPGRAHTKAAWHQVTLGRRCLDPLAQSHQGLGGAVLCDAVHVHLAGADHPVHVDKAGVCPLCGEGVVVHALAVDEAGCVSLAESDMAGGVFVEQRVPEEDSTLRYRRGVRNQGKLRPGAVRLRRC